jgi:hypothetical protein
MSIIKIATRVLAIIIPHIARPRPHSLPLLVLILIRAAIPNVIAAGNERSPESCSTMSKTVEGTDLGGGRFRSSHTARIK